MEVDGIEVPGTTPLDQVAVDPGTRHQVTVFCAQHEKETRWINGQPGERLAIDFSPRRIASLKPKIGTLRLNTVPWSNVYLGKRKLGMTPLLGVKLPVGTHTLTAVNSTKDIRKTFKVTIRPRKTTTLRVKLTD